MANSFLVLLGCLSSSGQGETFGTGFIVEYKSHWYVVSCKHVYSEVINKNSIFFISEPKLTKSPRNGYSVIHLSNPYFHPNDDALVTYDIVVFKLGTDEKQTLLTIGITPIQLSSDAKNIYEEYLVLYSMGYPVDYIEIQLAKNTEESLPPKIVEGYLQVVQLKDLAQHGFNGKLLEGYFIKTANGDKLGKGASGGLVYNKDENDSIKPIGLILAESDKDNITCVVYAKIERVIETLNSAI